MCMPCRANCGHIWDGKMAANQPMINIFEYSLTFLVNGHIMLNAPVLVRSPKLSSIEPRQYLDGWPPGNTGCCWQINFFLPFSIYTDILTRKVVLTCFFIGEIHNSTFLVSQNLSIEHGFFQRQRKIWPTRLIFSWNLKTLHLTIFWIFFDPIKKNRTFRGAERTQSSLKTSLDTHLDI